MKTTTAVAALSLVVATGCSRKGAGGPARIPVTVARAEQRAVRSEIPASGSAEPRQTVSVQSQVTGVLTRVAFREGDDVESGQVLFQIDARPFQAALDQARAMLARDQAQAQSAVLDAQRYAELVKQDYVTQSDYDAKRAAAEALQAVVRADSAAVANAELNLDWARIRAPIAGRTGRLLVREGKLVRANAPDPLVIINQIHPILVRFAVPERSLPDIQRYRKNRLPVLVSPSKEDTTFASGLLTFVDNSVDTTTGTVLLKAEFANREGVLWPGEFLSVRLQLYVEEQAVVVPAQAVMTGQQGTYVFVLNQDGTARSQPVTVERAAGSYAVIAQGVAAGDAVVTDGQLRLVSGAPGGGKGTAEPARGGGGVRGACAKWRGTSEHLRAVHQAARHDDARHDGDPRVRLDGVSPAAGEQPPQRGLPHDPSERGAARGESGDDGVRRGHTAREAVFDDRRGRSDDLVVEPRQHQHHAAVHAGSQHRRRRAGRAGGDLQDAAATPHRHRAAVVPEGEPGGPADHLLRVELEDAVAARAGRVRRDVHRAASLDGGRRGAGERVRRRQVRGAYPARSQGPGNPLDRDRRGGGRRRGGQREPADRHSLGTASRLHGAGERAAAGCGRVSPARDRLPQRRARAAPGPGAGAGRRAGQQERRLVQQQPGHRARDPTAAGHQHRGRGGPRALRHADPQTAAPRLGRPAAPLRPLGVDPRVARRRAVHAVPDPGAGGPRHLPVLAQPLGRSEEHTSELQSHHDLVCR